MCLAIAPNTQRSNHLPARLWRKLAASPFRLYAFGAVLHGLIGLAILITATVTSLTVNSHALMSGFVYGVLALLVFGFLMSWIPGKYSLSPVHYGRYNSAYLFIMVSLFLLEASSVNHSSAIRAYQLSEAGILLLIPGWLIVLQGLWDLHSWLRSNIALFSRALLLMLVVNATLLCLTGLDRMIPFPVSEIMPFISILLIWPIILAATLLLVIFAPKSGRKISL